MKSNVTEKLMAEHQLILQYIDLIKGLASRADKKLIRAEKDRLEFRNTLEQIILFVQQYADKYHHAKEESILFHFLEMPGRLTHCNPVPQMNYEHEEGRRAIRLTSEALEEKDELSALKYLYSWAMLLTEHIYRENWHFL